MDDLKILVVDDESRMRKLVKDFLIFDLSLKDQVADLAEKAWAMFGHIDVFYNNAGISQRGTTCDTEMRVINKVMDINWFAPVIMTKVILPKMIENGGGQLVVTTSINGRFGFPLRCAYSPRA